MERRVTVEFGPSRSKRFPKAVAEAQSGAGECSEIEPGRYRVRFVLGQDAAAYAGLARLLERVRHWRATEVDAAVREHEPGTLEYRSLQREDDEIVFLNVMAFADAAAEEAHRATEHVRRYVERLYPLCVEEPVFARYAPLEP